MANSNSIESTFNCNETAMWQCSYLSLNFTLVFTLFLQGLFLFPQVQLDPQRRPYPLQGQPVTFPFFEVFSFLAH